MAPGIDPSQSMSQNDSLNNSHAPDLSLNSGEFLINGSIVVEHNLEVISSSLQIEGDVLIQHGGSFAVDGNVFVNGNSHDFG